MYLFFIKVIKLYYNSFSLCKALVVLLGECDLRESKIVSIGIQESDFIYSAIIRGCLTFYDFVFKL